MGDADPLRLSPRLFEQMGSKGRRDPRHRDCSIPLLLMGERRHQGAVNTTGIGHAEGLL